MQRDLVKADAGKVVTGKLMTAHGVPFLARFLGKLVLDIMPAALASVIGGFLFTQYHFGHSAPKPVLEQVTPASAEMMALVRDEHAMIVDYLKTQMAAEKSRVAGEDADLARAQEDAKLADAKPAVAVPVIAAFDAKAADTKSADAKPAAEAGPRRSAAATTKPVVWHAKSSAVAAVVPLPQPAPRAPLVIAQSDPNQNPPASDRLANDPDSLLGKALDLKDHVVAGAHRAASAIGDVFATIGGALNPSASLPRQFSSND
ncbi:MAG TPA: hypothetical protein VHU22_15210 [Xanthobacteraceae bacterium]|nr:hypothetical protein [Xanthobacteraceae bacterium]